MGTTSATRRQSHVLLGMQATGHKQLAAALTTLGKGDQVRGAFLLAAATLAIAACLAPRIDADILGGLLLLAAAIAAALAIIGPSLATQRTGCESVGLPRPPASRPRALPSTLQDLMLANDTAPVRDLAHWHRLTHRMSHQLRTPLNAVLGFSELMSSEVFGPLGAPQYADYARNINASGRILLKSAEDALAITSLLTSASSRSRNCRASVQAALTDMMDFHGPELDKADLAVRCAIVPECDIIGEPQTLRQILINLMSECLDHAGGGATVSSGCMHDDDEVHITLTLEGPKAHLAGQDASFALMLARTLTQLSQARMTETGVAGRWSTTVTFQRALQRDFFSVQTQ